MGEVTLSELRGHVYGIVKHYFQGAMVIWSEQYAASPQLPLITLKMKDISLPSFPITTSNNNAPCAYYEATKVLEVNLYTKGKETTIEKRMTGSQNTAADDLLSFFMYLQSEYTLNQSMESNISIIPLGPVRDLTALVNDTRYEFRAMQEYEIRFVLENKGFSGQILNASPHSEPDRFEMTASGGGCQELYHKEAGYFEDVEIKEREEKGK